MRTLTLSSGAVMPVLGLGTWRMGESVCQRPAEIAALKQGLTLGMTLIDTAEMYGEGGAEAVIAEAIADCRDFAFLVSKFYPHHATRKGVIAACERSLQRLKTDYLDLYLLHWRSSVPLSETLEALQSLKTAGKIRDFGVSNFDVDDMEEAFTLEEGKAIAVNQVLYNLNRRGIEWDLLPWCRDRSIPIMAYSPVEQGRLLNNATLKTIAQERCATPAQIAIAWLLHQENVIVIPKASSFEHLEQNRAALDIHWSLDELKQLDTAFPPPKKKVHLQIL
jgi:diketogulonate reductase-like aldo/keto reductase